MSEICPLFSITYSDHRKILFFVHSFLSALVSITQKSIFWPSLRLTYLFSVIYSGTIITCTCRKSDFLLTYLCFNNIFGYSTLVQIAVIAYSSISWWRGRFPGVDVRCSGGLRPPARV